MIQEQSPDNRPHAFYLIRDALPESQFPQPVQVYLPAVQAMHKSYGLVFSVKGPLQLWQLIACE